MVLLVVLLVVAVDVEIGNTSLFVTEKKTNLKSPKLLLNLSSIKRWHPDGFPGK